MYAIKAAGIIPTFLDGTKVALVFGNLPPEFVAYVLSLIWYEGASPYDIFCAGLNGLVRHGNSIWLGRHRHDPSFRRHDEPSLANDSENELGTIDRADLVPAFRAKGTRLGNSEDWDNFNVAVDVPVFKFAQVQLSPYHRCVVPQHDPRYTARRAWANAPFR
ncbi:hypothetical protein BDZ89DRAFT_1050016 [Hymenopellis radicata]|nr:hypothetical protein BDZ89DRAFT_1050016 [Hymenopellis radicata]